MALTISGFDDLGRQIADVRTDFEALAARHGRGNVRQAIARGTSSGFAEIAEEAREEAKQYVPAENAERITHQPQGFDGDTYIHEMTTDDIVVASHEYGSGTHADPGYGSIDVPGEGYYIPKPRSDGPIRLTSHPQDSDSNPIIVEYVVHPGVKGKAFMRDTFRYNTDKIDEAVQRELEKVLEEQGLA